jgi:glycosyltransferase involved in cell wall biosynthesis
MIIGIVRVRNEEEIIKHTLDHVSKLVGSIIVVDDASTDYTPDICKQHKSVLTVIRNRYWDKTPEGRSKAEGDLRQLALEEAMKYNPEWIYYFDADEYADFSGIDLQDESIDAYRLRLFDFYITEEDKDKHFLDREFMGREYRDILMLFRPHPEIRFFQREPSLPKDYEIKTAGYVKHYGKAISVEEWEKTCDYYIYHRGASFLPEFRDKWLKRKGKAIHTQSDFGTNLITWEDRENLGIPLRE